MPGYPVGSYAAPPPGPPPRRSVWRAALWAVMTLSLLVVIGSMVWFVALRNRSGSEPAAGPQATVTASPTEDTEAQPEAPQGKAPAQTRTVVAAAPAPRTVVAPAQTVTVTPSDSTPSDSTSVDESDVESYGSGGGAVTSLPSGTYVTILDSLPKGRYSLDTAQQRAVSAGSGVFVVDSDPIPGLNSGYWALTVGPYSTRSEARSVCASYGRSVGGDCYDRGIG